MEKSEQNHDTNEWRLKQWNKTLRLITHSTACMRVRLCVKNLCTCDTKLSTSIDCLWQKRQCMLIEWECIWANTHASVNRVRVHAHAYVCVCILCMFLHGTGLCEYVLIVLKCCVLDLYIGEMVHQEMGAVVHELFDIVLSIAQTHK